VNLLPAFNRLIYAQVILGIIAYAVAEQSAAMVLAAGAIATLSWYTVEGPDGRPLPRWFINLGVITVTMWMFYSQVARLMPLIHGLGQFILAMQLFKLYERKGNRDYAQLIVLSLMQMICASIISAEILFGVMLMGYLVLTLLTLLQFQLKVGHDDVAAAIEQQTPPGAEATEPTIAFSPGLRRQFGLLATACGLGCLLLSVVFFVAMPRGHGEGIMGRWDMPRPAKVTGFDNQVQLSGGTRISTSRVPVMNVRLTRDGADIGSRDRSFLLRGTALDEYDPGSRVWTRGSAVTRSDRMLSLENVDAVPLVGALPRGQVIDLDITLRTSTKGILFSAYRPLRFETDSLQAIRFNPHDQVLSTPPRSTQTPQYRVRCLAKPSEDLRRYYLQSPSPLIFPGGFSPGFSMNWRLYARGAVVEDPRLQALARSILQAGGLSRDPLIESDPNDRLIADAIQRHLEERCAYTLDLPDVPDGVDPISGFLFQTRRGHCEYFASAMCAMLRSIGVRARVVTGFRVSEYNSVGGYYVVRQKSAHAWVEAWTDESGWLTFDPSPQEVVEELHDSGRGVLAAIRDLYEYLEFKWVDNIITYDRTQRSGVMEALDSRLDTFNRFGHGVSQRVTDFLRRIHARWFAKPLGQALGVGVLALIAVAMFLGVRGILRRRRRVRRLKLESAERREQHRLAVSLEFYLQMQAMLERAGYTKPAWQTPANFAQTLVHDDQERFAAVPPLTRMFYEIRFGGRPLDAERGQEIDRYLQQLRVAV